jgi:hypothetical protein
MGVSSVEIRAIDGNSSMESRVTSTKILMNGEVRQLRCGERGDVVQSFTAVC